MTDGCNGVIDEEDMYEGGWWKKLGYILAFACGEGWVTDVTRRYTRGDWSLTGVEGRRRRVCAGGSSVSDAIITRFNSLIRTSTNIHASRLTELDRRDKLERSYFRAKANAANSMNGDRGYTEGRISGSLAWRVFRGEAGTTKSSSESGNEETRTEKEKNSTFYHVESFHPSPYSTSSTSVEVTAPPDSVGPSYSHHIRVSGVSCGPGLRPDSDGGGVSIVVVDEIHSCILQCRSFEGWEDAGCFLDGVPNGRIVAVCGPGSGGEWEGMVGKGKNGLERVGGLDLSVLGTAEEKNSECKEDGQESKLRYLMCVGQINHVPEWATTLYQPSGGTSLQVTLDICSPQPDDTSSSSSPSQSPLTLRCEDRIVPQTIVMRLPDSAMPLETQRKANEKEKREAFLLFFFNEKKEKGGRLPESEYVGYCTKKGAPVYLTKKTAFPLKKCGSGDSGGKGGYWKTYHFLPRVLVPENDITENDDDATNSASTPPAFDIPIDESFFQTILGSTLLSNNSSNNNNNNNQPLQINDTISVLKHSRFIGLYFSAHWCPPCRKFTPMLIEVYEALREAVPYHGLEMVFVSSDRDEWSFREYFGSMPWKALPLDGERKRSLSERFGIQGIPSLVVLDSISGEVVISKEESREKIFAACRGGTASITRMLTDDWTKRVPPESQMIMETLALSCKEEAAPSPIYQKMESNPYLEQVRTCSASNHDPSTRIKEIFTELVASGLDPNTAAAHAIDRVSKDNTNILSSSPSCTTGTVTILSPPRVNFGVENDEEQCTHPTIVVHRPVAETAQRYLKNVLKTPYAYKFRSFRASNAVFDKIASSMNGVEAVAGLGFGIYPGEMDWMACVPLAADLEDMDRRIERVLVAEAEAESA